MKFASIFLMSLMFGLVAQAHPEATFKTFTNKGCRVWLTYQISVAYAPSWSGDCKLGYAEGLGSLKFPGQQFSYDGEMVRGMFQGNVTYGNDDDMFIIKYDSGWPIYASHTTTAEGEFEVEIEADGTITNNKIKDENHPELGQNRNQNDSQGSPSQGTSSSARKSSDDRTDSANTSEGSLVKTSGPEVIDGVDWSRAAKACPVDVSTYNYSSLEAPMQEHGFGVLNFFVFDKQSNQNYFGIDGWSYYFTMPDLSVSASIKSMDAVNKLTSADWSKVEVAVKSIMNSAPSPSDKDLDRKNQNVVLGLLNCYKNQSMIKEKKYSRRPLLKNPTSSQSNGSDNAKSFRAPFVDRACLDFSQPYKDQISDTFKVIKNNCSTPVAVIFCYYKNFDKDRSCKSFESGAVGWGLEKIGKDKSIMTADVIVAPWRVEYYVCDMTDPTKICVSPSTDQEHLHQTDQSR